MDNISYRVGALMYTPALNLSVGKKLCGGEFGELNSLVFCLEDSITEKGLKEAEIQLIKTLSYIAENSVNDLPLLFLRVRNSKQYISILKKLGSLTAVLTGIILPKFDLSNAAEYLYTTEKINTTLKHSLYIMPILESESVINLQTRERTLLSLRELIDSYKTHILGIRVGAVDFAGLYGLRRGAHQTVYDISLVKNVLTDILTVFSSNYVCSAPANEYFSGENALEKECELDNANGFIGKTIIHPSQIDIVKKYLAPTAEDYEDAVNILDWNDNIGVKKSFKGNRMNEVATHRKWAEKIVTLMNIYGIRGNNVRTQTCQA